jgi:hypothetical protein
MVVESLEQLRARYHKALEPLLDVDGKPPTDQRPYTFPCPNGLVFMVTRETNKLLMGGAPMTHVSVVLTHDSPLSNVVHGLHCHKKASKLIKKTVQNTFKQIAGFKLPPVPSVAEQDGALHWFILEDYDVSDTP